ncbi:MAG: hypothetical protein ABS61_01755 [Microbacterium sp. SCN 70-18]|nr:MAG: hypothetical protein ABS61_01755 [Microbacterium sp. SCN 70-18]
MTMSDWEPAAASDPKLLTVAGLLIPRKRPWLAVDALAKPDLDSYRLQFVGDGPLRSELERRCELLGVSDRVHFAGQLEHARVLEAIAASRLLLHPSAREGAAWVIGEAAAVGVAAVAFADVGCASTVKLSNNGGELAPPSHDLAASLAEATTRALAREMPPPSTRWNRERFEDLIAQWWSLQ